MMWAVRIELLSVSISAILCTSAAVPAVGGYLPHLSLNVMTGGGERDGYLWRAIFASDVSRRFCFFDCTNMQKKMTAHPPTDCGQFLLILWGSNRLPAAPFFYIYYSIRPAFVKMLAPLTHLARAGFLVNAACHCKVPPYVKTENQNEYTLRKKVPLYPYDIINIKYQLYHLE